MSSQYYETKLMTVSASDLRRNDYLMVAKDAHGRDRSGGLVRGSKMATRYTHVDLDYGTGEAPERTTYPFEPAAQVVVKRSAMTAEYEEGQRQAFLLENAARRYQDLVEEAATLRGKLLRYLQSGYDGEHLADTARAIYTAEAMKAAWDNVVIPTMVKMDSWDLVAVFDKCIRPLAERARWACSSSTDPLRNALRAAEQEGLLKMIDRFFIY